MMEERPTCCRRFRRIRAQGRRRTASLEISIASQRAKSRTFSTSCVRCNKESKPVTRVDENRRGFFLAPVARTAAVARRASRQRSRGGRLVFAELRKTQECF